jgi:hypothetical protein
MTKQNQVALSVLVLLNLASFRGEASEIWVPSPVLAAQYRTVNLPGATIPKDQEEAKIQECLRELKAAHPDYKRQCEALYARPSERGSVQHSLLAAHIGCDLHCSDAPVEFGNCSIQKYIDANGLQKAPFLLLIVHEPKRYTQNRLILTNGITETSAIASLMKEAKGIAACFP